MIDDLLVVGGGIVGLSIAFEALARGMRVTVLERDRVASGASGVAAGMLAPLCEAQDMPEALHGFAVESADAYPAFVEAIQTASGLDVDYVRAGTLLVAADRDELRELAQTVRMLERAGLEVQPLTVREVLREEPRLSARIAGGLRAHGDHHVDPVALCEAMAAVVRSRGRLVEGVEVTRVEGEPGALTVHTADTPWSAKQVVLAGGPWTDALMDDPLPLRPVKGQVLTLRGERLIHRVVRTPHVYLVPRSDDRLHIGASSEELGFDLRPGAGVVMDLLKEAYRVLPGIYDLALDRVAVGLRPCLRDGIPALGPTGRPGVFVATGHHRHGVLLAAATGRYMVSRLAGEHPWTPAFHPARFGDAQ